MNMAVFSVVGEMAKRGVGLTLLNHHCEMADPILPYDKNSVLFDSMGVWVVGKFSIETTRISSAAEHIFWGAAHPKCVGRAQHTCGYPASSYKHPPPPPQVVDPEGLNDALRQLRETVRTYAVGSEECKAAFGVPP